MSLKTVLEAKKEVEQKEGIFFSDGFIKLFAVVDEMFAKAEATSVSTFRNLFFDCHSIGYKVYLHDIVYDDTLISDFSDAVVFAKMYKMRCKAQGVKVKVVIGGSSICPVVYLVIKKD